MSKAKLESVYNVLNRILKGQQLYGKEWKKKYYEFSGKDKNFLNVNGYFQYTEKTK